MNLRLILVGVLCLNCQWMLKTAQAKKKKQVVEEVVKDNKISIIHVQSFDDLFAPATSIKSATLELHNRQGVIDDQLVKALQINTKEDVHKALKRFHKEAAEFVHLPAPEDKDSLVIVVNRNASKDIQELVIVINQAHEEYGEISSESQILFDKTTQILSAAEQQRMHVKAVVEDLANQGLGGIRKASKVEMRFSSNVEFVEQLQEEVRRLNSDASNSISVIQKVFYSK